MKDMLQFLVFVSDFSASERDESNMGEHNLILKENRIFKFIKRAKKTKIPLIRLKHDTYPLQVSCSLKSMKYVSLLAYVHTKAGSHEEKHGFSRNYQVFRNRNTTTTRFNAPQCIKSSLPIHMDWVRTLVLKKKNRDATLLPP